MTVRIATAGVWLDCITPLSDAALTAVRAERPDVVGIVRSSPLPRNNASAEIAAPEVQRIVFGHGYDLMIYQRVRGTQASGMLWTPSEHDGAEDAQCAAEWALKAGYELGASLWEDLEGTTKDSPEQVIGYVDPWGAAAAKVGYKPDLYVGFSPGLNGQQLYDRPGPTSYWHGGGGPEVAVRGCSMRQSGTVVIAGVTFDVNRVAPDLLGGLPSCMAA